MPGNLCGYVVRGQSPIPDAAIAVIESPGPYPDVSPLTDADGWFALDNLPAGHWRFRAYGTDGSEGTSDVFIWDDSLSEVTIALATPSGYNPHSVDNQTRKRPTVPRSRPTRKPPAPPLRNDVFTLPPGSIVGHVTDVSTGHPVEGALVVVTDGPGPLPDAITVTDADGGFFIPTLPPGDWGLRANAREVGEGELVVAVLSGGRVEVTITVAPH